MKITPQQHKRNNQRWIKEGEEEEPQDQLERRRRERRGKALQASKERKSRELI